MLEQRAAWSRFAEGINPHSRAIQAYVLAPVVGHAGFNRHALSALGQHAVLVSLILAVEHVGG